uniref:Zinc finger protein 592 n=1 Tax=Leptobrachium leishanense TaxID=445787 RepID=A0A8C5M4J0_9ANUR
MGDMKTPDFDDLLAAFDIPDATSLDPKEAIQSTSDEPENHLKPSGMCLDENLSLSQSVPAPDVPAVSVIVKNTSRQESFEGTEKEGNHMGSTFLQNGFRSPEVGTELHASEQVYIKLEPGFINGDSSRGYDKHESLKAEPLPTFNQFSPISSPEPEDYSKDNGILNKQKAEESPYFSQASMYVPVDPCVVDSLRKPCETELSMFDEYCKKEQKSDCMDMERSAEEIRDADKSNSFLGVSLPFKEENSSGDEKVLSESPVGSSAVPPRQRIKPAHSKLSSCVAALVALQAKKVSLVPKEEPLSVSIEAPVTLKESIKGSPKMPKSPKSPRSPLEVVKKISKPPDSPMSVCSDTSSKDSPSVSAGSPPAIPKVRIKTIKMSSGEIKRTVTRILPRVEPDDMVKSPEDFQGENSSSGEDVKPLALQDDVKPLAPREDVKPLAPREDMKPLAPQEDVKSLAPREDVKPLAPREDVKPLAPLEDVKPLAPLEDVKPLAPLEDVKPLAPLEDVKPFAPREEGKTVAPREEGKTVAPREEGKTVAPREEGKTVAPREEGKTVTPREEGKTVAPREEGKTVAPREEGKTVALREDVKPLALREDVKPLAPRDDVKPLAPREDVKPLVPVEDGKHFAPRDGKPLAPPEDVTCSEKPRNPVKTLPPNVVSSQVTNAKNEKKKGATPSNPPNPTSGSTKTSSSSQNKKQSSATTTKAASNPTTQLPKAVHLANLNLVPNSVSVPVPAKPTPVKPIQPLTVPLVHQVKVAAPVIVEAFNKLLHSANPVPTYTPNLSPPPECNILLPSSGYTCLECGDSFALERSLTQHHNRRSVHIEVMCTQCCKTVQFYNKCSLLGHAREHKSKGLIMQCSQLMMKPISADQMLSASHTFAPATIVQISPATQRTTASVAQQNAWTGVAYAPAMPLYADPYGLIRHGFKCLECSRQVEDYTCLAGHYQRVAEEKDGLTCQVCQMMLPNKCSYSAHQRTHTHKSPYCCPECGVLCRSAYFQTHVKENCLHYTRKVAFRCIHCGVVFMSLGMLKVHIQDKHCEVFHKCSFCPMAFKSVESTAAHITALHPTANHKNAQEIVDGAVIKLEIISISGGIP